MANENYIWAIQNAVKSINGIEQDYGTKNLSDGRFGTNTLNAMIDAFNFLDNYGVPPEEQFGINNDPSRSDKDKLKDLQKLLNQYGYVGSDGKKLTVDGAFGRNTAEAFSRFFADKWLAKNELDKKAIQMQEEQQLAQQRAKEQEQVYNNSPEVSAERPRVDMFSGVGLVAPQFSNPYNDVVETTTSRFKGFDTYGRPIYE